MDKEQEQWLIESLNEYYRIEGWDSIDKLPEDGIINLAYTTYDFDDDCEHDIEVKFDLNELCYLNYIDSDMVLKENVDSIEQFIDDLNASFDDMIYNCLKKGREIYGDNNDEK